jgi:hypothetical protein
MRFSQARRYNTSGQFLQAPGRAALVAPSTMPVKTDGSQTLLAIGVFLGRQDKSTAIGRVHVVGVF